MQLPREWIGLALVILGIARAALLVGHDPVVGYANQYDMIRTSACLGLFPALPEPQRYQAHPEAPLPLYKIEAVRQDLCYPSSEIVVDAVTVSLTRAMGLAHDNVKLQWVGFAKLGLLGLTALVIAWTLHRHPPAALLHGVIVFTLLCDPMVTLWFNTLYTEFAAIWALYAIIAAVTALAITERGAIPLTLVLVTGLAALAFSREQLALLAPALAFVSWPWLWQRSPHLTVAAFGVALIASMVAFELVPRPADVKMSNRADTYLGLVVPASSDTRRALATLGLPDRCEPLVGGSWYLQRGEILADACPEVFKLSSVAFLKLAAVEPEIVPRSIARALPTTQELAPPYLGVLQDAKMAAVNELPWWLASPLHAVVWRLPLFVYVTMVLVVMASVPLAFLAALGWARPSRTQHGTELLLAMMLGGTAAYALATTAFGDGLIEAARHFIPGSLAVYAAWIALLFAVPSVMLRWIATPKECILEMVAAAVAVIAIGLACRASLNWAVAQPLAIGTIDVPESRTITSGTPLSVRGWVLDPSGIESVTVEAGTSRHDPHSGESIPGLKRFFPGYPDVDGAGFSITLRPDELTQAGSTDPVTLRILAKSRAGPSIVVDQRRLEFRAP